MWSDEDLLEAWRGGDKQAGDGLVRRHYESIRRFFDLRIPVAAEDMTQQTFLVCVEGRERVHNAGSFRGYAFGVARRLLYRHLRSKERFERMARFKAAQGPDTALSPTGMVRLRQEHRLLLRALDLLPTDIQILVQLHYWEGLGRQDIAAVLEVPTSTVSTRLSRARERLRKEIEGIRVRAEVRESLLSDLERWTRSMVPGREAPA